MNPYLILGALVAALAAAGGGYLKGRHDAQLVAEAEAQVLFNAHRAEVDAANVRANEAAIAFETWKAKQRPKVITVEKEVTRVIRENHDWGLVALPDSVRNALAAAPADLGAAEHSDDVQPVRQPSAAF
jgi:hypothetical protein